MKKIIIALSVLMCISAAFFVFSVKSDNNSYNPLFGEIEALAQTESGSYDWGCRVICPNGAKMTPLFDFGTYEYITDEERRVV